MNRAVEKASAATVYIIIGKMTNYPHAFLIKNRSELITVQ